MSSRFVGGPCCQFNSQCEDIKGMPGAALHTCLSIIPLCLIYPGRTADEEDWCGGSQTNRV